MIAAGALALPSSAFAGALSVDHSAQTATYKAAAGEVNKISFYRLSNTYRIQDAGVTDVPLTEIGGTLCLAGEPWKYRCPSSSVTAATVSLGDGTDSFDGSNSSIAYTISAGADAKTITTGSGADTISARNGSVDQIACGDGADVVTADADDVVDASCEQVDRGTGGFTSGGTNDPSGGSGDDSHGTRAANGHDNVFETPLGLTVALTKVPVANSNARLRLACAASASHDCRGDVVLELPQGVAKHAQRNRVVAARGQFVARQRRRNRRLGKGTYRIPAGTTSTLSVRVANRGHYRYVSRRRRRAVLRVTERDFAGNVVDVQTRTVTLTANRGQR